MPQIALDSEDGGPFTWGAGTASWSHTCGGVGRFLVVHIGFQGGTPAVTGITYNGVAMTLGSFTTTGGIRNEWWYLMNPATGANNIVVSYSGTPSIGAFKGISFKNVDTGVAPQSAGTTSGNSNGATISSNNSFQPNFGVWLLTWISGGLGFNPSAPATGLTTVGNPIGLSNGGGASVPGQVIIESWGQVTVNPTTATLTANNGGSSYDFTTNGFFLAQMADEPRWPNRFFGCADVAWRTEPRD